MIEDRKRLRLWVMVRKPVSVTLKGYVYGEETHNQL